MTRNALLLVDLQYDFMPGGALAVRAGDEVVSIANLLMPKFDLVIATQDWHPADHLSFVSQHAGKQVGDVIQLDGQDQILWPDHCVQGTRGAELHQELNLTKINHVIQKGTDRNIDSYSGFFDNGHKKATGLASYLAAEKVKNVYIMGLATDYCVKFTALDAVFHGLSTNMIADGCRGVELKPGDIEASLAQLQQAGVQITTSTDI